VTQAHAAAELSKQHKAVLKVTWYEMLTALQGITPAEYFYSEREQWPLADCL
jgi:hypothetical protein